ncbi:MAG: NAD-dependent epimerase/dehydratase family protein [Rhizobiales bacterium]|nr:NAD-dependent epimerase/dehydratase family protein [Hyphomicrobiales bacterium]
MRVLVTGATGFVGQHALAGLKDSGVEIFGVSRNLPEATDGVNWVQADLLQTGDARRVVQEVRPDRILHLAWCVEHGRFWTDPVNLDWVAASLVLVREAAEQGAARFVATGTCYEYDWPENDDCDEALTPTASHTLYDTSKDALRRALTAYCAQSDVSFSWARLFFMYGPDEAPGRLVASLARSLVSGQDAAMSSGKVMRDFMDVRDVGAALARLVLSDVEGPINIAQGEPHSIREIAERLAALAGEPARLKIGALPDRAGEPPRISATVNRLRDEVGFSGARDLDTGLKQALEFWRGAARR